MATKEPPDTEGQEATNSRYTWRSWFESNPDLEARAKSIPDDPNETGWDRIKTAWRSFSSGEEVPFEIGILMQTVSMAGLAGFVFGGIMDSQERMRQLIRQHSANVYEGHYRANRQLSDKMYVTFMSKGVGAGFRLAVFTSLFVGGFTTATIYRNDIHFFDYAASGALTGMLWRFQLGPRAMLVSGTVGSIFGLTFAGLLKAYLMITDTSIREIRKYNMAVAEDLKIQRQASEQYHLR